MFAKHTGSDNFVCALEFILPDFRNYPLRTSRFRCRTFLFALRLGFRAACSGDSRPALIQFSV